ncbi:MAG: hypothetical protein IH595_04285 [Bacteroidales bacterium]|nr:hypothetical protein [Bacteroidales bacterium]
MANITGISQKAWSNEITLSWTNPSEKVDGVVIERAIGNGASSKVAELNYGTVTWIDKNIQEGGVLYTYKIYAVAGQNKSEISEKQITPILPPKVSVKIDNIKSDSATVSVHIENEGGKVNYYEIMLSKTPDFKDLAIDYSDFSNPDSIISKRFKLEDTTTYYTKVRIQSHYNSNLEDTTVEGETFTTPLTPKITWNTNHLIVNPGDSLFYSKIEADTLVIGDSVEVDNYGTSEVIIDVKVLIMGKNSVIRVRNGYYSGAPANPINDFVYKPDTELYPNVYGKGGNGGNGVYLGGGGGGGFGGGQGGQPGAGFSGYYETAGHSNGGDGGNGGGYSFAGTGGGRFHVGLDGGYESGGGGNSGKGNSFFGLIAPGGGGGGYGGGVLLINTSEIIWDQTNAPKYAPKFLVSGQKGGQGGSPGGNDGQNGQGGILIINNQKGSLWNSMWDLAWPETYGTHDENWNTDTGHGVVTGGPSKVYINGTQE